MTRYLIIKRTALKEDGWAYGDWRQYVAFRDDGSAACVRMSSLPATLGLVGLFVAMCLSVAMLTWPPGTIAWGRAWASLSLALSMVGVWSLFTMTQWRLVVIVGKVTQRADGSYYRVLAGDKE